MFEFVRYCWLCLKLLWLEDNGWISKEEADRKCLEYLDDLF